MLRSGPKGFYCKELFVVLETVPDNKELLAETVPANKELLAGTFPANKELLAGTVPANNLFQYLKWSAYCHDIDQHQYKNRKHHHQQALDLK